MNIQFFCPRWGNELLSWDAFCKKVKEAGYDGVEAGIPFDEQEKKNISRSLKENGLLLIGQYFQSFEKEWGQHAAGYEKQLRNLISMQPVLIDAQTGKDYYTPAQNKQLFELAHALSVESGITIAHETHRNKALFAAHVAEHLLKENPYVKITADFSHWCCVAESLLEDQQEAVQLACERAVHIHARVGFAEGPQVNDPRAAEWKSTVDAHLQWWDAIISNRKKSGAKVMTITPEFGPAPYLPALPHSMAPVANQWDINVHMMKLLKQRYA
ncbi:MAG: sugar phosphate isomerase/epimerase [Chitinophagaceae bacterium]|nr:sugar phosphate isomerase/epimerase [Chitinophagaceae bacterium]